MARYMVREAVLLNEPGGSMWHVMFAAMDGSEAEEISVTVSPVKLEQMTFAAPYTAIEIEALREEGPA